MKILQRSNYLIFFDDVRVDNYVVNWSASNGLFANDATASITLFRSEAMDNWKAYLTQVKIFGENPFTKKFTMLFDGEIMNRSWNQSRSNMGTVTFQAKGYYHWLDIQVPLAIQSTDEDDPLLRFMYEAQNINIDEVRTLITSNSEALMKDKSIEEIIEQLFEKLTIGYYEAAGENTAFAFARVKERFRVMVDVLPEFRESGFLDLFTYSKTSQIESFFVYLNEILSQLMFEFYQDRDGTFRIKTPSWSDSLLKAHVIDSSVVSTVSGLDDWEQEPTRVLAIGSETQYQMSMRQQGLEVDDYMSHLHIPVGLYIGDPRDPDNEEYYSVILEKYFQQYGINPMDYDAGGGPAFTGAWFDNTGNYTVTSDHRTLNSKRPKHMGTDYDFKNEPVYNIGSNGVVVAQGYHGSNASPGKSGSGMGNYVTVEQNLNGKKYFFRYMHFQSPAIVKVGAHVTPGQLLGTSGTTGGSTGPHLHLEIWEGAINVADVEPVAFLKKHGAANSTVSQRNNSSITESDHSGAAPTTKVSTTNTTISGGPWQHYQMTHYTARCPGCSGITKAGWNVLDISIDHRVIATDPSLIPMGSIVEIEGLGYYNAVDTGGVIKGKLIDLLVATRDEAYSRGRKEIKLRLIRSGKGDGSIVPPVPYGTTSTYNGSSGSVPFSLPGSTGAFGAVTGAYAAVDNPLTFKKNLSFLSSPTPKKTEKAEPVPYTSINVGIIPSYADNFKNAITNNTGKISPLILTSIIEKTSGWREKHSTSTQVGLMGIPKDYADNVFGGQNLLDGNTSINLGSDVLRAGMDKFKNKMSFALAAYHMGSLDAVAKIAEKTGVLDFSKARTQFDSGTLSFVDSVIKTYTSGRGNYLTGDPHINFGTYQDSDSGPQRLGEDGKPAVFDNAIAEDSELPDFAEDYRPTISLEERKYKVNLKRVEQALIRADSPAVEESGMTADKLIYQFAKYNMQLHRARTHNINVNLTTCLPFIRPGYNAWIEPTRTDVVCYVTGVSHQGSFQNGCTTSINGGFVRDPGNYKDVDSSIFIGEMRADSSVFGELVEAEDMQGIRNDLVAMHDKQLVGEASNFTVLNDLYSSMNDRNEYTTRWNKEYTIEEVVSEMSSVFSFAKEVVIERKQETADAISQSHDIFVEKLMFMVDK